MPPPLLALGTTALFRCAALVVVLTAVCSIAHAQSSAAPGLDPGVLSIPRVTPPPRIAARELQLSSDLRAIGDQARYSGWLGAAVITVGCAAVSVGAIYASEAGALLLPLGALALSRGVLGLTLMAGRERQTAQYLSLPTYTSEQLRARIQFGEALFAYHARRARLGRIIDGSVSLGVAASYVPLAWWLARRDDPSYRFRDDGFGYALLALSVVNAGAALTALFSESIVEQRHKAYRQLVERQEREHPGELSSFAASLSLSAVATRSELALQAGYAF